MGRDRVLLLAYVALCLKNIDSNQMIKHQSCGSPEKLLPAGKKQGGTIQRHHHTLWCSISAGIFFRMLFVFFSNSIPDIRNSSYSDPPQSAVAKVMLVLHSWYCIWTEYIKQLPLDGFILKFMNFFIDWEVGAQGFGSWCSFWVLLWFFHKHEGFPPRSRPWKK